MAFWHSDAAFAQTPSVSDIRLQQEMLVWTTDYDGLIDGKLGPGTTQAIQQFQTRLGHAATGLLTPAEELKLEQQGNAKKTRAGFQQVMDQIAGVTVGIPLRFVTGPTTTKWGSHWAGDRAGLSIDTLRFRGDVSLHDLFSRLTTINARQITYQRFVDNDWFVLSAFEGDAAVYVRGDLVNLSSQQKEIRGFSVWMSKDRPVDYQAIPPAMLSTFSTAIPMGGDLEPIPKNMAMPNSLPQNPPPMRVSSPAASASDCYRGLGEHCPSILAIK